MIRTRPKADAEKHPKEDADTRPANVDTLPKTDVDTLTPYEADSNTHPRADAVCLCHTVLNGTEQYVEIRASQLVPPSNIVCAGSHVIRIR